MYRNRGAHESYLCLVFIEFLLRTLFALQLIKGYPYWIRADATSSPAEHGPKRSDSLAKIALAQVGMRGQVYHALHEILGAGVSRYT